MDSNKIKEAFLFLKKICKPRFILAILILAYIFLINPDKWFNKPVSTVVYDSQGELLGAHLAKDEQWRFPEDSFISPKVEKCLIYFEDEYFYYHPGVNPVSLVKATFKNIVSGRIERGASTITMQLCRIHRENSKRSIFGKIYEIVLATRVELHYSKREILTKYLSNAPFGGNVVGLEAASWRYFGRSTRNLSWAEAATLAVLPNAPALIHPGKNRKTLEKKRNNLLLKLLLNKIIDKEQYQLAILENIPDRPNPLPADAKHVTDFFAMKNSQIVKTTLVKRHQLNLERITKEYLKILEINKIGNIAAIVVDVKTNNVIAYAGNTCNGKVSSSPDVDIVTSPRSTGSIIKPLLYAYMLQDGKILPTTLIPDIPTRISGFNPNNYDETYNGAVPAKLALSRSLNVPVVKMLQSFGVDKFYNFLKKSGMTSLNYSPDRYGLTLVVGGAEGKLFDLAGIYANFSRVLTNYNKTQKYFNEDICPLKLTPGKLDYKHPSEVPNLLDAGSIYLMFEALLEVNRPEEDANWKNLSSSRKIAWKTGTSYGFRDAWAIGTTPEYVVGVWVGNANGEGRPGLTGINAAAPLMFNIFSSLPKTSWYKIPYDELTKVVICKESGFKAGRFCQNTDTIYTTVNGSRTGVCPYHKLVHLTKDKRFRLTLACDDKQEMINVPWFILPPAQEWYYKKQNPFYKELPPLKVNCGTDDVEPMEIVYPAEVYKIYIPRELNGAKGNLVIEVAHRNPKATLYWHIDDEFMFETTYFHQIAISPSPGMHKITIIDNFGNTLIKKFQVLE
jgi:penicillin-binding protein 1C